MDINAIMQLIGSFGFPIFACIFLYIQGEKEREEHHEETKKLSETIESNTVTLKLILEYFRNEDKIND